MSSFNRSNKSLVSHNPLHGWIPPYPGAALEINFEGVIFSDVAMFVFVIIKLAGEARDHYCCLFAENYTFYKKYKLFSAHFRNTH